MLHQNWKSSLTKLFIIPWSTTLPFGLSSYEAFCTEGNIPKDAWAHHYPTWNLAQLATWPHLQLGPTCNLAPLAIWPHLQFGPTCNLAPLAIWPHLQLGPTCNFSNGGHLVPWEQWGTLSGSEDWDLRIWIWGFESEDLNLRIWIWGFESEDLNLRIWIWGFESENRDLRILRKFWSD